MVEKKPTGPMEPKYQLAELAARVDVLFNCRPEVVAGAVCGSNQTEYTVAEMREYISKFLNKKVNH